MATGNYNILCAKAYILQGERAKRVMESWCVAVEIYLTKKRYNERLKQHWNPTGTAPAYRYRNNNYQTRILPQHDTDEHNREVHNTYTTAFFDLIDNENQNTSDGQCPIDRVSGFTILQIQEIVRQCSSWDDVVEKFKNVYPPEIIDPSTGMPVRDLIDELLNNWE